MSEPYTKEDLLELFARMTDGKDAFFKFDSEDEKETFKKSFTDTWNKETEHTLDSLISIVKDVYKNHFSSPNISFNFFLLYSKMWPSLFLIIK